MVGAVGFDELLGDILSTVGGTIIDDDDFVVELPEAGVSICVTWIVSRLVRSSLFRECLVNQPYDDRQVAPFIVCWQKH